MKFLLFKEHLQEKSAEVFNTKRNKIIKFKPINDPEIEKEFFDLISIAYSEIGGHLKIKSPKDVFSDPELNFWEGVDIHGDSDFDIIVFAKKTKYGVKFSGVGHDGEKDSKRKYLDMRGDNLRKLGFYVEVSGKVADILMSKYQVPVVTDAEDVKKALGGKDINWIGDGWYERKIGDKTIKKIMLGKPKV